MDRTTIAQLARRMETRDDLLALLNSVKESQLEEIGMQDKFHPFTQKHLLYFCNPNHTFRRYRQFTIKKKSGGERLITAPRYKSYKMLLGCLNEVFKAIYTPSSHAMGFAEGRSVVDNAAQHTGMNYVLNLDLKDFFPSIEQARVWKRLQLKPFEFPVPVASAIAGLCCMKETVETADGGTAVRYVLPQGAPTSPIITNMICDKLDRRLAGLAKRFGLRYTRYADDMTFSSMHYVYQPNGEFFTELRRIIAEQGFTINEKKTRLQKVGSRQEVTGLTVGQKVNVTQQYIRDIRNILYIWDRYGYGVAFNKFFPKYKAEKGHVKKGDPDMVNVLDGKLTYLKMVRGEHDSVYQRLQNKFQQLADTLTDSMSTTMQGVTYVETLPLVEFERKNETEVVITTSVKEAQGEGEAATPTTHRYGYFEVGGRKIKASVNKSVPAEMEGQKELLAISNCRDKQGKEFWLIHRADKITVPEPPQVDVDKLNTDLDTLLNFEEWTINLDQP